MDYKLKPGSERLVVVKNAKAGSHEFICTLHTDMKGTVIVR
jgi:plastocyanin